MGNLRSTVLLTASFVIGLFAAPVQAKYGGGTGEPNDPYLIYDANQMNTIGLNQGDWGKCFKLMADIDLGDYEGQEFNIIGRNSSNPFTGIFDGNGHGISNLNYSSTATSSVGLFGYISGENAEIKDLRLIDPNVNAGAYDYVGSLVGYLSYGTVINCCVEGGSVKGHDRVSGLVGYSSSGTITDCSVTGTVAGNYYVGGLVGYSSSGTITDSSATGSVTGDYCVGGLLGYSSGAISNCRATTTTCGRYSIGGLLGESYGAITYSYASGIVEGDSQVGGLVGINHGPIVNCYAAGPVTGTQYAGGLAGSNSGGHAINSYWDIETSGQTASAGGEGKTTVEMMTASTFFGWGTCEAVWTIDEGEDYPRLAWEKKPGEPIVGPFPFEGEGDPNSPYLVNTAEELNIIGLLPCTWDKHFKVTADIDLSNLEGTGFHVIGHQYLAFTGVFDGNDHRISNLNYSSTATDYVGLFGWAGGENAEIKNLTLTDPNIDAGSGDYVGCLVGRLSNGTVADCSAQGGRITGFNYVGGLIGSADSATVEGCSATAGVLGGGYVGGLTGLLANGIIKNCNASGAIAGSHYVGGLAGNVSGAVTNSFATGSVWAEGGYAGGLIGDSDSDATIDKCYAAGPVVAGGYAGGLVGDNDGPVTNCYATGDVWADEDVGGLVGYNRAMVTNCYSTGAVWALNYYWSGGLVGHNTGNYVVNSFWNTETSGLPTSYGGTGRDTAALQTQATFTDAGWDFVGEDENGSEDIWRLCNQGGEYPKLAWQYLPGDFLCPDYVDFLDFAQLGRWWLAPDPCAADLTGDGFINAQDLIVESRNWLMGIAPGRPGNPDPPNFAKQAPWYADLAWTPDPFAQSYDVYFGPANPPGFITNQTATTFWPGIMEYQTSYYWRIDGVNTWGKTAGPLWIFTTASPAQATNPYPFDGQIVGANTGLRWDAGSGAVSHDIYFGTTDPPPFLRNQTAASFYQYGLTYETRYYWRIDEVSAGGTTRGVVWSFTPGGSAR